MFENILKKPLKEIFKLNRDIISVKPDMLARDLSFLFMEKDISGTPVVDENKNLIGIVSMTDLAKSEAIFDLKGVLELIFLDAPSSVMEIVNSHLSENFHELTVEDIMTNDPISVTQNDNLCDVVKLMLDNNIHRIIVAEGEKPIGIITNTDILEVISQSCINCH